MMNVYQSPNLITPSSQTPSLDVPIPCSSYTISYPDCQLEICPLPNNNLTDVSPVRKRKTIKLPRKKDTSSKEYLISRLEKKLARYQSSIEEAGNTELSLDDLKYEDNSLHRLSLLEKKASLIWEQICDLKGKSDKIMVMSDLLKNVTCTPYPAINQRIERFFKRNTLDLPDIVDVSDMISKVNEKESLSLSKAELLRLSKHVLQFVGNLMSERRRADLYEVLKSRTERDELAIGPDPLVHDPLFKTRLEENDASFRKKIQETLSHYSVQQDEMGTNSEAVTETDPASDNVKFEDTSFCDSEHSPLFSPTLLPSDTTGSFSQFPEVTQEQPNISNPPTTTSEQVSSDTTTNVYNSESVFVTQDCIPRRVKLTTITEPSDTNTPEYNTSRRSPERLCTSLTPQLKRTNPVTDNSSTNTIKRSPSHVDKGSCATEGLTTQQSSSKRIKLEQNATIVISSDEEQ